MGFTIVVFDNDVIVGKFIRSHHCERWRSQIKVEVNHGVGDGFLEKLVMKGVKTALGLVAL